MPLLQTIQGVRSECFEVVFKVAVKLGNAIGSARGEAVTDGLGGGAVCIERGELLTTKDLLDAVDGVRYLGRRARVGRAGAEGRFNIAVDSTSYRNEGDGAMRCDLVTNSRQR